jgi:hypothetical protein
MRTGSLNGGLMYVSCSPLDDATVAPTETETEDGDNLQCEIVQDADGVWSTVSNPSSTTINGLQVQVLALRD